MPLLRESGHVRRGRGCSVEYLLPAATFSCDLLKLAGEIGDLRLAVCKRLGPVLALGRIMLGTSPIEVSIFGNIVQLHFGRLEITLKDDCIKTGADDDKKSESQQTRGKTNTTTHYISSR